MKKRIVWIAALLALAAVLAIAIMRSAPKTTIMPVEPDAARSFMRASLTYDAGLRTLRGTQMLKAENRTGETLHEIVLRLYMNANLGESAAISGVSVNGKNVTAAQDADDPTVVRIDYPWQSGETVEIAWTVMIKHAKSEGAAIITLPQLAMSEDGAWRTDAYDGLAEPSYAQAFDCVIELDGEITASMRMARDASFVLESGAKAKEKEICGVTVRVLGRDAGAAKKLLDAAEAALGSLGEIGIAYPFDRLTIADGETARADGAVYSGLIALDAGADKEALIRKMTRLIARQTFGILIENDPWNAPWLSETIASGAEMLAFRVRKSAAAYEERLYGEMELATRVTRPVGVNVGASTAHFGSDAEMEQVLRDQGASMLLGIEQAVGEEAFLQALHAYIDACAGGVGSKEALCLALYQATGSSWDGYISDMLAF